MPKSTKPVHKHQDPTQPPERRYLSNDAAARYCGMSGSYFEKLRVTGEGAVHIRIGRKILYDVQDLDAWLASRKRLSTSETVGA